MKKERLKQTGAVLGLLFTLFLIWGLVEPYFIKIESEVASIPNLPKKWQGEKIAVMGDFQIGMWMDNETTVKRAVKEVVDRRPTVVILLGDFVYHPIQNRESEIRKVVQFLKPLAEADIPVFAVLGNHDYAMDSIDNDPKWKVANQVKMSLERLGIEVLRNEIIPLNMTNKGVIVGQKTASSLYLAGIGATWPDQAYPKKVLNRAPETKPHISVMHNPEAFEKMNSYSAPLAVAGHTHGSQVRIPYLSKWLFSSFSNEEKIHLAGWIDGIGEKGNHLYVNPGIGFSNFPIRINCTPEITIFELQRQSSKST